MKRTIITLLICLPLMGIAQGQSKKISIWDETRIDSTKTYVIVKTSSQEVYFSIMPQNRDSVRKVLIYPNKVDRRGKYQEMWVYFPISYSRRITEFLTKL